MLSKLFSSKSKSTTAPKEKSLTRLKSASNGQEVMKDAKRELHSFDKPVQELGMTSLLQSHQSGNRFLYAAVTANQDEDDSSRLRRLIQHKPKLNRKAIPLENLPLLPLYKETEEFKLSSLLSGKSKQNAPDTYINISEVLVVYGSLISSDSAFSHVRVCIVDNRHMSNKIAKSYVANTNTHNKASMSLSYSFPRKEIDQISLTLSMEAQFLEEGSQWGVAQVQIRLTETSFPIQTNNTAVRAINALPQSVLEDRDVDPDFIDITMSEDNRKAMRDLYMEGDLADETEPVKARTEAVKYAKSSLSGPKGKKRDNAIAASDWSFMNDSRSAGIEKGLASIEPSEDGYEDTSRRDSGPVQLKSAMKPTVVDSEDSVEEIPRDPPRRVRVADPNEFYRN